MNIVEVKTLGVGVQLHRHSVFGRSLEHRVKIEWVSIASQQLPSGGMPDQRGVGIGGGLKQPIGHGGAILVEQRMHAGNDDVHLVEHRVGGIGQANPENVEFDSRENAGAL